MDYRQRRETGTGWNARRTAGLGLILAVVVFFLPLLTVGGEPVLGLAQQGEGGGAAQGESVETQAAKDRGKVVKLLQEDGTVTELTMEDYLFGVVAAEMPASFELEALKAQTCAARTYTVRKQNNPTQAHPDADVCTDTGCCQAYVTREAAETRWGLSAGEYSQKIAQAIAETDGMGILYQGQPIQAVFFSSAPGYTVDAVEVWGNSVDYLKSVESPEGVYGDNVFEKDGIRRDRTGDGEKTRCLCGKRGIFNRDGPAMGPQIIRQLERGASRRSASFFHALASPGRPRNGGGASGAYQPAEGRKALIQGRFRAQEGPLGPSRKSQQQTKRTGFAALEDSIADEAPEGKRAKRANRALNRAGINSRGQKQGFGGADRRAGRVTSR